MTRLFIDTGLWVAGVNQRDPHFTAADAVLRRIQRGEWGEVTTSDHVLAETLNFIRMKIRRQEAARAFLDHVFGDDEAPPLVTNVLRVHGSRFAVALDRYQRESDRGLSFTDWTSVVVMQDEGIDTIATFDERFQGLVPHVVP